MSDAIKVVGGIGGLIVSFALLLWGLEDETPRPKQLTAGEIPESPEQFLEYLGGGQG